MSLYVRIFVLKLFLINIENTCWSSMFLNFTLYHQFLDFGIVLSLFLIFGDFEPRCSYKIVLIKKECRRRHGLLNFQFCRPWPMTCRYFAILVNYQQYLRPTSFPKNNLYLQVPDMLFEIRWSSFSTEKKLFHSNVFDAISCFANIFGGRNLFLYFYPSDLAEYVIVIARAEYNNILKK